MSNFPITIESRAVRRLLKKIPDGEKELADDEDDIEDGVIGARGARKRDRKYTRLLDIFLSNYTSNKKQMYLQKRVFFYSVLALFGVLVISGVGILFFVLFNKEIAANTALAAIIGASIDILGSFIAIPLVIAKHLFPEKVDNDIIDVVKLLVENDSNIRDVVEKHNGKGVDDGEL